MAKIQKLNDPQGVELYPYTIERAVYDSNGYTAEQKFSEVKPSFLYGETNYDITDIDVSELHEYDFSLGSSNYLATGTHSKVYVQPGWVVKFVTAIPCRVHLLSNLSIQNSSGTSIDSVSTQRLDGQKTYYFTIPEGVTAFGFNRTDADSHDATPSELTVAVPKVKELDTTEVSLSSARRIMISGNGDKLTNTYFSDAVSFVFPVKAGKKYEVRPTYTGNLRYAYIDDVPYTDQEVSNYGYATSDSGSSGIVVNLSPNKDRYFFICSYKADTAALSVIAKEVVEDLSKVNLDNVYNDTEFDIAEIDPSELYAFDLSLDEKSYKQDGSHSKLYVQPGQVVKFTTGPACRIHFFSDLNIKSSADNGIGSVSTQWLGALKTYYFTIQSGISAFAFNQIDQDGYTVAPSSLSILTPKIKGYDKNLSITPTRARRIMISGAGDVLVRSNFYDSYSYVIPVKAGKTYYIWPTYTGTLRLGYIDDVPYEGEAVTSFETYVASSGDSGMSIRKQPASDGFLFVCSYKSETAALSVVAHEVPNEANSTEMDDVGSVKSLVDTIYEKSSGYDQIAIGELERRPYSVRTDTALYGSSADYKHVIIPVEAGQNIKVVANTNSSTRIAWLTSDETPVSGNLPPYVAGTRVFSVSSGTTLVATVPTGCSYMLVYTGLGEANTPIFVGVYNGETGGGGGIPSDVLSLNPDSEFIPKLISANKRYYTSSNTTSAYPLIIAHISDIHGNWNNVSRFIEFCDHHSDRIQCRINTGDTVVSYLYNNGVKYTGMDTYNGLEGVGSILNVIGNHDTASRTNGVWDWQACVGVEAYNEYLAPHISSWDVIQPDGAAANGYCYYYKDYSDNNVRLVVTDVMGYDDTQDSWLASVLASARTSGLHVVIATHFSSSSTYAERENVAFTKYDCNYSTLYVAGTNAVNLNAYNAEAYKMMVTVDAFQQAGGIFVGYIQGHYHLDFAAKVGKFPNQLIFSIGSSKSGEVSDYMHTVGQRDQDEFQIVSIDTYGKIVKLYKVGANVDRFGRHKNSLCVSYDTHNVISEAY